MRRRAFLGLTLLLLGCDEDLGPVPPTKFRVQGQTLILNSEITHETPAIFEQIMAENPQITTLVLQDVPGSLDDDSMIKLGYRVRALGLNTHLTATSQVHSGGVDLFLAGRRRSMEPGARLGVHAWAGLTSEATDFPPEAPEHDASVNYTYDMLGSDAFYWFTIHAAPADEIYILTPADIARFGLLTP